MSKYFLGFPGFDCCKDIWEDILGTNKKGGSKRLQVLLSMTTVKIDKSRFSRMLHGDNAWTDVDAFLGYSTDAEKYKTKWEKHWDDSSICKDVFEKFNNSVPPTAQNEEEIWILPVARQVESYLKQVIERYESSSDGKYKAKLIAAGMYVLVAFFLQNKKDTIPKFYGPHKDIDPVKLQDTVSFELPEVVMQEPTALEQEAKLPFDLFGYLHNIFQDKPSELDEHLRIYKEIRDESPNVIITPAEIHRKLVTFSEVIDAGDVTQIDGSWSGLFLIEDILHKDSEDCYWYLRHKLVPVPYERNGEQYQLVAKAKCFEDDTAYEAAFAIFWDGLHRCLPRPSCFTEEGLMPSGIVSHETKYCCLSIDKYGHKRNLEMEEMLSSFKLNAISKGDAIAFPRRIATVSFDKEYMDYQFFDMETMTEIPVDPPIYDRITGEYLLHVSIPCPCSLIVFKNTATRLDPDVAQRLIVSGSLHGHLACKKDLARAILIMEDCADRGEVSMCFQYGAWLKSKGDFGRAQRYLRPAANHGNPGAKFELAELLLEKGDTEEARELLEELWQQGYRTYGTKSIDLLGEYSKKALSGN